MQQREWRFRALMEASEGLAGRLGAGGENPTITGLCYDSRLVQPGMLFCCVRGERSDGHDYAAQAVEKGAAALLAERELPLPVPQFVVADSRRAMSLVAACWYGYPARRVKMVGITGTNGKTSATVILKGIGEAAGHTVGVIGTVGFLLSPAYPGGPERHIDRERNTATTPMGPELQELIAEMADEGADWVVMECASHALDQGRCAGIVYDAAGFTNLTQDHLDYHHTMDNYLAAKAKLFDQCRAAVINADDPYGVRLLEALEGASFPVYGYSLEDDAAISAQDLKLDALGARFTLRLPNREPVEAVLHLRGRFSVANALVAAGCAACLGLSEEEIVRGLYAARGAEGRFEVVESSAPFTVVVDYAHTPDGLEKILFAARGITRGRLIAVFGCGGDRDATKRPVMGRIGGTLADTTILTSDNPRTEDPMAILAEVEAGLKPLGVPYRVTENRRAAIEQALGEAREGDVVAICGKGHEPYQEIMGVKHPFDDRVVAREALKGLGYL